MVTKRWKLDAETIKAIEALSSTLSQEADDIEEQASEQSERWQEGEKAGNVEVWVDEIREVIDALDNLNHEAE